MGLWSKRHFFVSQCFKVKNCKIHLFCKFSNLIISKATSLYVTSAAWLRYFAQRLLDYPTNKLQYCFISLASD